MQGCSYHERELLCRNRLLDWYVMFPDKTRRYSVSRTGVQTRNRPSSMTVIIGTRGIKNVYQVALMTMLGKELYLTRYYDGPNWGKQTAASQLSSKCWLDNSP